MYEGESENDLSLMLQNQYQHIEDYCNAQTLMCNSFNNSATSKDSSARVDRLLRCTQLVRQDLQQLEKFILDNRNSRLEAHIATSKRVIKTVAQNPSWHRNGIPSQQTPDIEANTVALAALKASISVVLNGH